MYKDSTRKTICMGKQLSNLVGIREEQAQNAEPPLQNQIDFCSVCKRSKTPKHIKMLKAAYKALITCSFIDEKRAETIIIRYRLKANTLPYASNVCTRKMRTHFINEAWRSRANQIRSQQSRGGLAYIIWRRVTAERCTVKSTRPPEQDTKSQSDQPLPREAKLTYCNQRLRTAHGKNQVGRCQRRWNFISVIEGNGKCSYDFTTTDASKELWSVNCPLYLWRYFLPDV